MGRHADWDFGDLDGYIRMGEPDQATRAENWQTAIGLQAVDGLRTSAYLLETAREHIEGRIDISEASSASTATTRSAANVARRRDLRRQTSSPAVSQGC